MGRPKGNKAPDLAPSKSSSRKQNKDSNKKPEKKNPSAPRRKEQPQQKQSRSQAAEQDQDSNQIDISATIPLNMQQLLLNVFKSALLFDNSDIEETGSELDTKTLIQTIKSHLYNRDFDSAFADADEQLLRAYALRWSATRALGYAGLFKSILKVLVDEDGASGMGSTRVIGIGGGAGAEIVALAAAWRDLRDEGVIPASRSGDGLEGALEGVSLEDKEDNAKDGQGNEGKKPEQKESPTPTPTPSLSISAVDIADWSAVVKRLSSAIQSPSVPSPTSHPAPLVPQPEENSQSTFNVDFKRLDVLTPNQDLTSLFQPSQTQAHKEKTIVSLMFTLNELFTTSMARATSFLLCTTDLLSIGTILLVVDSPGSYSTLKLKKESGETQERQYPMKFLLDHTLLSVAKGKWEKVHGQESRWWRRDASNLEYEVGEGAGLEDMRFQVHVYRRV
ncbi:25S rRNA (uracil2843-N3)-methyltransferase [Aspergillus stella-maris]|uniref:25S rRNA (uracil2843-N3)-methyltransferase n=1 Tax=Aspergillus stella-maris TaxID=1810926 RepID=UPI003CCE09ED